MRLLGLLVIAVLAACAGGVGQAFAAPGTTTPSTPGTPSTPTAPSTPGSPSTPGTGLPGTGPGLGIPLLDEVLNALSGGGAGSSEGDDSAPTSQMIVVTAPRASDTTATLTPFERGSDGSWKPVFEPTKAFLGSQGMGEPKDNVPRTPEGTFALDQAFGRQENPGTKMPYIKVDQQDWWDSDMTSPTYNTHVRQPQSPGGDSENLYNMGPVYDYAVNIAHNPERTPGRASAMFLHVTNDQPTLGCVAIERELMKKILVWLDPAKNPKITIGVNKGAPTGDIPGAPAPGSTPPSGTTPTTPGTTPPTGDSSPAIPSPEALGDTALTGLLTQLVGALPSLLGAATQP